MLTIRFSQQADLESVQACIDDLSSSGGVAYATSFTQAQQIVDIQVDIVDESMFRQAFILTPSYLHSDYQ